MYRQNVKFMKKIDFNYYDFMMKNGGYERDKQSAQISLENLNKALSLNGANDYAVYYLACIYAQMNNSEACIAALEHLEKIKSVDAEGLLEMVKTESDFGLVREAPAFAKLMETIEM